LDCNRIMEIKREVRKGIEAKDYECEVVKVELYDNKTFLLEITKPEGFEFKAGQFAMIHTHGSEKPFSIASPPSLKNLQFLIKEHDEGTVTQYLDDLKKGDKLKITAPFGVFCVRDTKAKELYFIAAGTGVAPFRSMICDFS
jgi:NAD(P)H-flavin reductase